MGLLSIIRKLKLREKEMRLLILGLDNAGKTTVVRRFNGEDTTSIAPTLGFSIVTLEYRGYKLTCWDIGGQKSIRAYWRNYFEQTDGLVWVVDSSDVARLRDCREELCKLLQEERLAGATLLVFANKQDLSGAASVAAIVDVLQLATVQKRHWRIQPYVWLLATCALAHCCQVLGCHGSWTGRGHAVPR